MSSWHEKRGIRDFNKLSRETNNNNNNNTNNNNNNNNNYLM